MATDERLQRHLREGVIGFPTALAASVGVIMASPVILTVSSGFGMGGGTFAVAMVVALVMMLAQATTFAEAACILPTAGSVYDYVAAGLGRVPAITATISAYLIVHLFAGTAETVLSGVLALVNFETLDQLMAPVGGSWVVGVGLVCLFGLLNAVGISAFAKVEVFLTFGMWISLTIFGVVGLIEPPAVSLGGWFGDPVSFADLGNVATLVGMAMFMFVGCELVTPLAPELRHAHRNLPTAMPVGLVGVAICMFLFGAALRHQVANVALDPEGTTHLLDTPGAIPRLADQVMGPWGRVWLGIALLFAGGATINTLIAAVSRIIYGMAVDGALPSVFAYLHPRFKTPVAGIAAAVAMPCSLALYIRGDVAKITTLVLAAVCAWGIAYLLVTLSVIALRVRRPDLHRAYRSPLYPLPQVVSSVGIVIALWNIAPAGMSAWDIYLPFGVMIGLAAVYAFVWTVFVQRHAPFEPVPVEEILDRELGPGHRA